MVIIRSVSRMIYVFVLIALIMLWIPAVTHVDRLPLALGFARLAAGDDRQLPGDDARLPREARHLVRRTVLSRRVATALAVAVGGVAVAFAAVAFVPSAELPQTLPIAIIITIAARILATARLRSPVGRSSPAGRGTSPAPPPAADRCRFAAAPGRGRVSAWRRSPCHDGAVTWTAPEVTRYDGPLTGGERAILQAFLDWHRATLLLKCAGLTGEQLAERAVPPSDLSLLGLVRHLTGSSAPGSGSGSPTSPSRTRTGKMPPSRTPTRRGRRPTTRGSPRSGELADAAAANAPLDATFTHNGETMSLRLIYLHMIEEYARHIGHADLLRERVDGTTGE